MKKIIIIIGLVLISLPILGQTFNTTLTQVDLYQGNDFSTFVSSQTINYDFTLDNTYDKIVISNAETNVFIFDITNKSKVDYEGHDFLVMDLINTNTTKRSRMIIVDKPLKTNTMQLLFNFEDNRSLIFDTNFKLD